MQNAEIRQQWESAAPGWAHWEATIDTWMGPATEAMFDMAGIDAGARVLDLASGAGSQTLRAARRMGRHGHVVANDIAESMLQRVRASAHAAGLTNVSTLAGAAEELDLAAGSFDAVVCRFGLMLFTAPAQALAAARRALKSRGKFAALVLSAPAANPFLAKPLHVLLRHAGRAAPALGRLRMFALGDAGMMKSLLAQNGLIEVEQRTFAAPLLLPSAAQTLVMMQDAFGDYRAVISDRPELVRAAAWAEVARTLKAFAAPTGFVGPAEALIAAGVKPA